MIASTELEKRLFVVGIIVDNLKILVGNLIAGRIDIGIAVIEMACLWVAVYTEN